MRAYAQRSELLHKAREWFPLGEQGLSLNKHHHRSLGKIGQLHPDNPSLRLFLSEN